MKSAKESQRWRGWKSCQSWVAILALAFVAACGQSSDEAAVGVAPGAQVSTETSPAALGLSGEIWIESRSNDLYVDYGRYTQVEFRLRGSYTGSVNWNVLENSLPAGLSMRSSWGESILVSGTPEFTGQWCFVLNAETRDSRGWETIRTFKDVCFIGNDYSSGRLRFVTDRFLPAATQGQYYSQDILIDIGHSRSYRGSHDSGTLPYGISIRSDDWSKRFVLSGRSDQTGVHRFVLRITDDYGQKVYRQFQLSVESSGWGGQHCPPGYYYDSYRGYCVPSGNERCSSGYYWDSYLNRCVPNGSPPPGHSCAPGYYYDSYLGRCVLLDSQRCPLNYEWDSYYQKCVRSPYSCPVGYTYSWVTRECVRSTPRSCPSGYYYDSYRDQCLPYTQSCPSGQYWDSVLGRCVSSGRDCPPGTHWDYSANRCVSNSTQCPPGTVWDSYSRECRRNTPPSSCAPGYYWSHAENRCIRHSPPPGSGSGSGPGHGSGHGSGRG